MRRKVVDLGAADRYEVHGFVPGRGFLARFYEADSIPEAIDAFKREFPRGLVFWAARAAEAAMGFAMGLHEPAEREAALELASEAYRLAMDAAYRGDLRVAAGGAGYLKAVVDLAAAARQEDLAQAAWTMYQELQAEVESTWPG
jgi:hypothetical protein